MSRWMLILSVLGIIGCSRTHVCQRKQAESLVSLAHEELAGGLRDEGALRRALALLDRASVLSSDMMLSIQALRATLLWRLGDTASARVLFESLLDQKTDTSKKIDHALRADIMNNFSCLLAQSGESDQALQYWHELAEDNAYLTPECAYINQGMVYAQRGDSLHARRAFEEAIRSSPSNPAGYLALARFALGVIHDPELARSSIATLQFLVPDAPIIALLSTQLSSMSRGFLPLSS